MLEYDDGASKLPDPYFMQDGRQNDPSQWPDLTFGDIYRYQWRRKVPKSGGHTDT